MVKTRIKTVTNDSQQEHGNSLLNLKSLKYIILFAILLLFANTNSKVQAFEKQAGSSAQLVQNQTIGFKTSDERVEALQNIFKKYDSPLTDYAYVYIKYADQNEIDWKLLPAISGLESTFGRFYLPGTYNAYGWGGGYIYFTSWEDGIATISQALKTNYYNRGADNVYEIGPIYAESPTWAVRVDGLMNEINNEYLKIISSNLTPSI